MRPHGKLSRSNDGPEILLSAMQGLKPGTNLQLDMSGVEHMDGRSVRAMMSGLLAVKQKGGSISVTGLRQQPEESFRLGHFYSVVPASNINGDPIVANAPVRSTNAIIAQTAQQPPAATHQ